MNKHTPGPWFTSVPNEGGGILIKPIPGQVIAQCDELPEMEANAKHIVACVNACEGLPEGCLDGGWTALGAGQYAKKLEVINAELLDALENAIPALELYKAYGWTDRKNVIFKAKAAIAKARGEL